MTNVGDVLIDVDTSADEPMVLWEGHSLTRREIADAVDRLAATIRGAGAAPDTAAVAVVPTSPIGVVMLFGIWRAGAAAAPVAPSAHDDALARRIEDIRPSVVVTPSNDRQSLVPQIAARVGAPRNYDERVAVVVPSADAGAGIDRVPLDHADVLATVQARLRPTTPHLLTLPIAHWSGMTELLVATHASVPTVLVDPAEPADVVEAIRTHRITSAVLAPSTLVSLAAAPDVTSLAPLEHLRCAAGAAPVEVARRIRDRFGVTVANTYGRIELGGEVIGWSAADLRHHGDGKVGSVGRPYDGVEVRVVDADGSDAGIDKRGELRIRSPFARGAVAYGRGGPLVARIDPQGFMRTGDIARVDRDGFLWVDAAEPE